MALLSLIVALLIEQIRPLPKAFPVRNPLAWLAHALGKRHSTPVADATGVIAWGLGVGGLTMLCAGAYGMLYWINPLLG